MSRITRIINGKIVEIDEHAPVVQPNATEARANRENQKVVYRKELLQKNQVDYFKAYPEKAKELSPELRRLLS